MRLNASTSSVLKHALPDNYRRETMKRSTIATVLTLTVFASPIWGQAANAQDPHHPASGAAVQPATPQTQPGMSGRQGMMGGMPMMNMMGGMPMMGMMRMMGPDMAGMATVDRVEGRIAFLLTELKITEAQAGAWNAFAEALRTNAHRLSEVRASMMPLPGAVQQQAPTMAQRLDLQERWLLARLEGTRAIKSAFTNLYGTLSDDQKNTANELLAPHISRCSRGQMQPGMMQPGQMQPGQMQPGQMQPGQMQPGQMQPGMMQPGQMQPGQMQPGQMQPGGR
jgi:LTXXQ motif family protein